MLRWDNPTEREDNMKMPDSEAKKKWTRENMYTVGLKLHRKNDADIIAFLQGKEIGATLREVIREHIAKHDGK